MGLTRSCIAALIMVVWPLLAAGAPTITGVRIAEHVKMTRFVLDLSESIQNNVFVLPDPDRVVVDMPEIDWRVGNGPTAGGLIKSYRIARFKPGQWRLVLDLAAPAEVFRSFILPPQGRFGYRFVIDLKPAGAAGSAINPAASTKTARLAVPGAPPLPTARPQNSKKPVIVIDPGHGGADPGAISRTGSREKDLMLQFGRVLRDVLVARGRYRVVMTRSSDRYVRLRERVRISRTSKADLMLSLHADTIRQRKVRGATVYTLSEKASDAEAASLAARENKSDVIAGVDLGNQSDEVANILIDLAQRATMNRSVEFVQVMLPELGRATRLRTRPHRSAGFRVLKAPDVPSVLIELGYLSNKYDERSLRNRANRKAMARALVRAIDRYFDSVWQK